MLCLASQSDDFDVAVSTSDPIDVAVCDSHVPVLRREVVDLLAPKAGGVYFDGTLGAGGHTLALLQATDPDGRVVACDRDPDALALAHRRLKNFATRLVATRGVFADVGQHLAGAGIGAVDGMVLDLGYSSMQIDSAERGFSFARPGPLDMRMDPDDRQSARELIADTPLPQLVSILRDFGEERYSKRIARVLKDEVAAGRMLTTDELATAVQRCVPSVPGPPRQDPSGDAHLSSTAHRGKSRARSIDPLLGVLSPVPASWWSMRDHQLPLPRRSPCQKCVSRFGVVVSSAPRSRRPRGRTQRTSMRADHQEAGHGPDRRSRGQPASSICKTSCL